MRAPVLSCNWWKCTSLCCTAEWSFTGTLTSPRLMEPDQIARAMSGHFAIDLPGVVPAQHVDGVGRRPAVVQGDLHDDRIVAALVRGGDGVERLLVDRE